VHPLTICNEDARGCVANDTLPPFPPTCGEGAPRAHTTRWDKTGRRCPLFYAEKLSA
jgi:hypothetical protein